MPIDSDQQVTVLGLGYIGLPTAALIARSGSKVTGVDVSQHVVDTVNNGKVHIEEVDLDGLVQGVVTRGALVASIEVVPADVFVIAVLDAESFSSSFSLNVFVIAVIFRYFHVPESWQHRVLIWGILGALVMRAVMRSKPSCASMSSTTVSRRGAIGKAFLYS